MGTWESQFLGIGRLTHILSARLLAESFAVDDVALYVMFLQRHRVEVGLKLILERANAAPPNTHNLVTLLNQVRTALTASGLGAQWPAFDSAVGEYVRLVDEIDEGAATFRYPVDTQQQPWAREDFIDLVEFEKAGASFQDAVLSLVEDLAELEPLPIDATDAVEVASQLRDLAVICRRMNAVNDSILDQMKKDVGRLGRGQQSGTSDPAMRGSLAVRQNAEDLAHRADRMRLRVEREFNVALPPPPPERPRPTIPPFTFSFSPTQMNEQLRAVMEGAAKAMMDWMKPLRDAADAVYARSADWSTPYARQLRDEVGRLRSRLSRLP